MTALFGALAAAPVALAAALSPSSAGWLLVAGVALAGVSEARAAPTRDAAGTGVDRLASTASALTLLAIWCLATATAAAIGAAMVVGSILFAAGLALRQGALRALGDRYCSHPRAAPRSELATTGLYARLRHPSELGLLLLGLGAAVATASWAAGLLWLALAVPLTWVRCAREDRFLRAAFGERHARYCRRVRAFGP